MHILPALLVATVSQAASQQDVANYVRDQVLGGSFHGETLWMTDAPLDRAHVARDSDPAIPDLLFPFTATWLVMIDDSPDALFSHPVRWLFVSDSLQEHGAPMDKADPPTVFGQLGSGSEILFRCAAVTPTPCPEPNSPVFVESPAAREPRADTHTGEDKDCLYAVLVSGGESNAKNHPSFAESLAMVYRKLRQCAYPRKNISTFYATGSDLDLDNDDADNNPMTGSDVDWPAREFEIRLQIEYLCKTLDPTKDVLFIYLTSHGVETPRSRTRDGLHLWDFNGNGKAEADEVYSPDELAEDTRDCRVCKLYIIVDSCFSGMFLGLAADGQRKNTAVYASASSSEVAYGSLSGHTYTKEWAKPGTPPGERKADDMHPPSLPPDSRGKASTPGKASGASGISNVGNSSICECCKKVGDSAHGDGETYFSSSEWTKDGETIGETFPGGVVPAALSTEYTTAGLQVPPNDWHGHVLTTCRDQPARLDYTIENFAPDDQLTLQFFCASSASLQPLTLHVDVGADQYTVRDGAAVVQAEGAWTGYPANLPASFQLTTLTRRNYVEQHCPSLCDPVCAEYDPCACHPDCNPACPDYDRCTCIPDVCDPACPSYDPCACAPGPCNPYCPEFTPCLCPAYGTCDPSCPTYDPCRCSPGPCNPACPEYDSCDLSCMGAIPCNPQCQHDCQACCFNDFCDYRPLEWCASSGGRPQGSGTVCETTNCVQDCNENEVADFLDVLIGTSRDCNFNYVPDECEPDGDEDGVIDSCDYCPHTVSGSSVDAFGCPAQIDGDRDRDGDVDSQDWAAFSSCASGANIPFGPTCADLDLDVDGDVDQSDFGRFQECYSGVNRPAAPACAGHSRLRSAGSGVLMVDLRATDGTAGQALWNNGGALGDFVAIGQPMLSTAANVEAVTFDGDDAYQGPLAPLELRGGQGRTIEVWAFNPTVDEGIETMVAWGHRGGPAGTNLAFGFGNSPLWGAVGHWGDADLGWSDVGGSPTPGQWHHMVYTYKPDDGGGTTRVYVDGVQANSEASGPLAAQPGHINLAMQNLSANPMDLWTASEVGTLSLAVVRVHDGALSPADVDFNYHLGISGGRQTP